MRQEHCCLRETCLPKRIEDLSPNLREMADYGVYKEISRDMAESVVDDAEMKIFFAGSIRGGRQLIPTYG